MPPHTAAAVDSAANPLQTGAIAAAAVSRKMRRGRPWGPTALIHIVALPTFWQVARPRRPRDDSPSQAKCLVAASAKFREGAPIVLALPDGKCRVGAHLGALWRK